jgi:hypothetical protein
MAMTHTGKLPVGDQHVGVAFGHPQHGGHLTDVEYGVSWDGHIIAVHGDE